ncbi:F-box/LRR-repeat protein 20 [Biomphalaria glabrata]
MNNHNHNNHYSNHTKHKSEEKSRRKRRSNSKNGAPPCSFDWTSISQSTYEDDALINKKLPKELLLRIFSYLDVVSLCRCAQVSKYWNMLALDGSNWQNIDLFDFQTDIEGRVVEYMSQRCGGFLKSLSLKGCQSITDTALQNFAQQCRHIETLILSKCTSITDL